MFEFLKGILYSKDMDAVIIDVSGVGFHINTSAQTLSSIGNTGDSVTVYTYMSVKEDDISLYGFSTKEELSAYKMLISVSGVGPKMALSVLSSMSPQKFSLAVASQDHSALTKCKGVGSKLAQRMVLELKDKVKKNMKIDTYAPEDEFEAVPTGYVNSDAISALMVLGYTSKDAASVVRKVYKDGMTLEETVRSALKNGK